jgi:hypothetical protein
VRLSLGFAAASVTLLLNGLTAAQFAPFSIDLAATIHMGSAPPIVSNLTTDFGLPRGHTAGGTFNARDNLLDSFTMHVHQNGDAGSKFRFIVLGTDETGAPKLPVLWESSDQTEPVGQAYVPFTLFPNLPIEIGRKYYLGVDTGKFTTVQGELMAFGVNETDSIPEGNVWQTLFFVPEPATSVLTLALIAHLFALRRRTK